MSERALCPTWTIVPAKRDRESGECSVSVNACISTASACKSMLPWELLASNRQRKNGDRETHNNKQGQRFLFIGF